MFTVNLDRGIENNFFWIFVFDLSGLEIFMYQVWILME